VVQPLWNYVNMTRVREELGNLNVCRVAIALKYHTQEKGANPQGEMTPDDISTVPRGNAVLNGAVETSSQSHWEIERRITR
jgi:hypothetical protein